MKLNTKYILCFFIGIILYLLLNNISTFNIGIPPPASGGAAGGSAAGGSTSGGAAYPIEYYCSRLGLDVVGEDKDALEKVKGYINENMSEIKDSLLEKKDSIEFGISEDEWRNFFSGVTGGGGEGLKKNYISYNIKNEDDIARFLCFIHNFLGQLDTDDISLKDIGETLAEQRTIRDTIENLSNFFSDAEAEGPGGGGQTSEGRPFMSLKDWEGRVKGLEGQGSSKKKEPSVNPTVGPSEDSDL